MTTVREWVSIGIKVNTKKRLDNTMRKKDGYDDFINGLLDEHDRNGR